MSRTSASSFTTPTSVPSGTSFHEAPGRSFTHQNVIVVPFAVARTPPGAIFAATAAATSPGTGSECLTPVRSAAWLRLKTSETRSQVIDVDDVDSTRERERVGESEGPEAPRIMDEYLRYSTDAMARVRVRP